LAALCNQITLFEHVFGAFQVFNVRNLGIQLVVFKLGVAVEGDCVLSLNDEVDLSDVLLLLVEISLFLVGFKLAGHEAERDFIQKVGVQVAARTEEALEGTHRENVLKQEFAHNVVLDASGNRVEELEALHEHRCPIVVPKPAEMGLNFISQIDRNV